MSLTNLPLSSEVACPICDSWSDNMRTYGLSLDSFEEAGNDGCERCWLLSRGMQALPPGLRPSYNDRIRVFGFHISFPEKPLLELEMFRAPSISSQDLLFLASDEYLEVKTPLPGSTSSQKTLETVGSWIKDCLETHENCNLGHPNQLPKRILEIFDQQVILRENQDKKERYVCLSHCWGKNSSMLKNTRDTIESFKTGIPIKALPNTFRDAVDFCQRLGLRYLWIDSLCIKQDDIEDWREQAGKMGNIYENGFLTIAAAHSPDSTGGCYIETNPRYLAYYDSSTRAYIREIPPSIDRPDQYNDGTSSWPLLRRGWAFQERLLSPRVVYFGPQEVSWQCKALGEANFWNEKDDSPSRSTNHRDDNGLSGTTQRTWYPIVERYSSLELTFKEDRLPALAALAQKESESRNGDTYIAGLWKSTILSDLLWGKKNSNTNQKTSTSLPSWSWASIQSPVAWHWYFKSGFARWIPFRGVAMVDLQYDLNGPSHVGLVRNAKLTLRVPLISATLIHTAYPSSSIFEIVYRTSIQIDVGEFDYMFSTGKFECSLDFNFACPGDYHILSGTTVYLALIGVFIIDISERLRRRDSDPAALILKQRDSKSGFERIGLAEVTFSDTVSKITSLDKFLDKVAEIPLSEITIF